jgi:hypothetical protein
MEVTGCYGKLVVVSMVNEGYEKSLVAIKIYGCYGAKIFAPDFLFENNW